MNTKVVSIMLVLCIAALYSTTALSIPRVDVPSIAIENRAPVDYYAPKPCINCQVIVTPTPTSKPYTKVGIDFTIDPLKSSNYKLNSVITLTAFQTSGPTLSSNAQWAWTTTGSQAYGQIATIKLNKPGKWSFRLTVRDSTNYLEGSIAKSNIIMVVA